jgi:hypothetical protein
METPRLPRGFATRHFLSSLYENGVDPELIKFFKGEVYRERYQTIEIDTGTGKERGKGFSYGKTD